MNISARNVFKVLSLILLFIVMVLAAYAARGVLVWIGTAFFLAIALNPAVEYLSRYMPGRSRGLAAGSVFLIAILLLTFLVSTLAPPIVKQSEQLVRNSPEFTNNLIYGNSYVSEQIRALNLVDHVKQSQDQILSYASSAGGSFFSIVGGVFSGFAASVTILVLTFFMLLEGPVWIVALWAIVPAKRQKRARHLVTQMYDAVTGYVTGNILTSLLAAVLTAATLAIIGVPYAIPLGILVGLFDLLPLVGATIGAAIVVLAALFSSVGAAIIMIIFFIIYQQIENHVLQPVVYGRTVKMSPLLVLVSVLIGASIGGIIGAIVAIPAGASLRIVLMEISKNSLAAKE